MHNIGSHLTKRSKISSNKEAFVEFEKQRRFTFLALNKRCNKTANALQGLGVKPGDRVATLCKNGIEFVESYFALAKIGAVMVPVNWRLVANEANYILTDAGVTVLLFDTVFNELVGQVKDLNSSIEHYVSIGASSPSYASDYDELAERAGDSEPAIGGGDDDLLFIMYTSGTTGHPKGVMHSHNNMLWAEFTSLVTSDMQNEDRFLMPMPMFHVGTLIPVSQLVHRGATGVIMRDLDLPEMFKAIEQEKITITMSVPALLQFMLRTPEFEKTDMSSIRWIATGAAPVPVSLLKEYEALGIMIYQAYGLTESCGPGTLLLPGDGEDKVGSCGKPQMHTEARIVRADGSDVAGNGEEIGELILSGKHMMLGYWNKPEATAEALRDGWLHTGDLCSIDSDGFITIRDRMKDMIISGGENIYPAELENILAACIEVQEAAVIGLTSAKWGETPLAIVVAAPGQSPTAESLINYCKQNLASYKIPQLFEFVDTLPRNPSGKLLKPQLREKFSEPAPF
ncbi:MAG: O-succinylbenzoate-CoA ligase [Pseudomonadales bacterium]|jgi:O-succinylbenzoate-CoA ligase